MNDTKKCECDSHYEIGGLNCKCGNVRDARTAVDIAADLVSALSRVYGDEMTEFGGIHNEQWARFAREFLAHQDGKAACKLRRERFWERMRQATAVTDSWPKWVAGKRENKR